MVLLYNSLCSAQASLSCWLGPCPWLLPLACYCPIGSCIQTWPELQRKPHPALRLQLTAPKSSSLCCGCPCPCCCAVLYQVSMIGAKGNLCCPVLVLSLAALQDGARFPWCPTWHSLFAARHTRKNRDDDLMWQGACNMPLCRSKHWGLRGQRADAGVVSAMMGPPNAASKALGHSCAAGQQHLCFVGLFLTVKP